MGGAFKKIFFKFNNCHLFSGLKSPQKLHFVEFLICDFPVGLPSVFVKRHRASQHVREGAARLGSRLGVARGGLALAISGPAGGQRTERLSRLQASCSLFADHLQTVLCIQTFPSSLRGRASSESAGPPHVALFTSIISCVTSSGCLVI